jgi:hypothetical protein
MADLQFDEPQYARPSAAAGRGSWLTGLVIKSGLAQDEQGAQKVLLVVLVLAVIATIVVMMAGGSGGAGDSILNPDV